jgi:hypothetical protein
MCLKKISSLPERKLLTFIILLSFLVKALWLLLFNPEIASDANWYFEKAGEIASGSGYLSEGHKTAFYPVGYPAFLSFVYYVFGQSILAGRLANLLLSLLSVYFLYLITRRFVQNKWIRLLTVLLYALYPNHVAYVNLLYNETLFTTLFLLALHFQLKGFDKDKYWDFLFSAICYALAVYTRPAVVFIPFIVLFLNIFFRHCSMYPFHFQKSLKLISLYLFVILLILLPWQIRNYKVFNSFVFVSTTGGFDLLIGNHPGATGNYNPNVDYFSAIERSMNEVEYDKHCKHLAWHYIKSHPKENLKRIPYKAYYFFWPGMDGVSWNFKGLDKPETRFLNFIRFCGNIDYLILLLLFFVLVIMGLFKSKNRSFYFWLMLGIGTYYLVISLVFFGESRFHFHLIPLGAVFIAERLESIFQLNDLDS